MGLQQNEPKFADVEARFGIAADSRVIEDIDMRKDYQESIRDSIVTAALDIEASVEDGREKSLALTYLEEALMWAGKAIFK